MIELWDLYDENRNSLNKTHISGYEKLPGEYHIVSEIWTINEKGEILLTLTDMMPLCGISNNPEEVQNEFPMEIILEFFPCEDDFSSRVVTLKKKNIQIFGKLQAVQLMQRKAAKQEQFESYMKKQVYV